MASVKLSFNKLLTGVRSRVEEEGKTGISVSKVPAAALPQEPANDKVVFSLRDFIEKKKLEEAAEVRKTEEVMKSDGETDGDSDIEEVVPPKEKEDESSDEEVVNDVESMDDDTDSDLELIKSDQSSENKDEVVKEKPKGDPDSDIDNEIEKLHDIIDELSTPEAPTGKKQTEEKVTKEAKENKESVTIESEDESNSDPQGNEKARLGKFAGLSILKNSGAEASRLQEVKKSDASLPQPSDVPPPSSRPPHLSKGKTPVSRRTRSKRKATESPARTEKQTVKAKRAAAADEAPIMVEDDEEETKKEDKEATLEEKAEEYEMEVEADQENNVTSEFDLCTHGDLMYDYMCYECTYNRWRVSWNAVQPEGRRKERPEFLELSHKLNLGNLRNISIQRAAPKPQPDASKGEEEKADKENKKPDEKKEPEEKQRSEKPEVTKPSEARPPPREGGGMKLPPGVHLSKPGDPKKPSAGPTKLPSGISFSSTRTGGAEESSTDDKTTKEENFEEERSEDKQKTEEKVGVPTDAGEIIKNVNWAQVFAFMSAPPPAAAAAPSPPPAAPAPPPAEPAAPTPAAE